MTKKIVKINEMQLRNLVAETIERIAEDTKAQRKKDPMNQWFKDADKLSRLRDMSNPTYDAERQKNIDKALKESGDTRRGSYMKGRTIGRKMAKGDTSTVGKDNLGNYPEMGELGMKDQYGYEMAAKNSGLFGNPFKADERLQDIQDRYERLKHDDKFFGDWDKHINGQLNEAQLRKMIAESIKKVLKEESEPITIGSPEDGRGCHVTIAGDSLGPYAEFNVYGVGTDAQAAVDAAVDYLEKNGETGYFWDNEEAAQEYPDDFVTAGNCGHLLRVDLFHVEQM